VPSQFRGFGRPKDMLDARFRGHAILLLVNQALEATWMIVASFPMSTTDLQERPPDLSTLELDNPMTVYGPLLAVQLVSWSSSSLVSVAKLDAKVPLPWTRRESRGRRPRRGSSNGWGRTTPAAGFQQVNTTPVALRDASPPQLRRGVFVQTCEFRDRN